MKRQALPLTKSGFLFFLPWLKKLGVTYPHGKIWKLGIPLFHIDQEWSIEEVMAWYGKTVLLGFGF